MKKSKNQLRRERAKLLKKQERTINNDNTLKPKLGIHDKITKPGKVNEMEKSQVHKANVEIPIENVKPLSKDEISNLEDSYKEIFEKFNKQNDENESNDLELTNETDSTDKQKEIVLGSDEDSDNTDSESNQTKSNLNLNVTSNLTDHNNLTKRKFKKLYTIPLSVLKSESKFPELVDWKDVNSPDPRLFIYLKTLPNSVYIPPHWQSKKNFLSTKRGIERPPFKLPKFILDTGILEMRNITDESENDSTLKQRMRERVQPKSGQLDIDYNKLYDAFFKYQQKPPLLKFGELYTETTNTDDIILKDQISRIKIGSLSKKLKFALGMIDENNNIKNKLSPWFYRMQQLGPPPSYPYMKIDQNGKVSFNNPNELNIGPPIITKHWGILENDLDSSDNESENENDNDKEKNRNIQETDFDSTKGDVLLKTFGDDPTEKTLFVNKTPEVSDDRPRQLYQVLQNGSISDSNSIFGSKTSYYKIPPK